jgi:hypothetical protein
MVKVTSTEYNLLEMKAERGINVIVNDKSNSDTYEYLISFDNVPLL